MAFYKYSNLDTVNYKLEDFNFIGPLDVLLSMVKEQKIDIKDIFISDITHQFIEYVNALRNDEKEINYENISDFITEAATLLYIKSTKYLPRTEEPDEFMDGPSEEERYIMRLEEYARIKELAIKLSEQEILNRFYHNPRFTKEDELTVIKDYNFEKLMAAFRYLMENAIHREAEQIPQKIVKERFTVSQLAVEIASVVREEEQVNFYGLFRADYDKEDILNVFLAVLQLLKKGVAKAKALDNGDILLQHNPDDTGEEITNIDESEGINAETND